MTEVKSIDAQQRCTWEYVAVDFAAAAFASALVVPWVTAIDKIVFNKAVKGYSMKSSVKSWFSSPRLAFKTLFIPFLVYFGTYATANMFDSYHAANNCIDPTTISSTTEKFVTTTAVSTGLCVFKDAHFASLATKGPVPLLSYALFTARDAVTVFASFHLPTMIAPRIAECSLPDFMSPISSFIKSDHGQLKVAQVLAPVASQIVSTPLHLLGLDVHKRQKKITIRDRFDKVRSHTSFATSLRMFRILPAYGIGGVANTSFRGSMMPRVI